MPGEMSVTSEYADDTTLMAEREELKTLLMTVRGFIFLGSKMTAHGDYSHEIKIDLLLERKVMTKLVS